MNTSLVIMAAGLGTRYGSGIKQLARVDDREHIIMDYSIHDAIEAGFNRIICVIRRDIEKDFYEIIGNRLLEVCENAQVDFLTCYQDMTDIPFAVPRDAEGRERTKPWGTVHAVLAAREYLDSPFAVINADDYYGRQIFRTMHDYLDADRAPDDLCMAGYLLKNTLSNHGTVTRGICKVSAEGYLEDVVETKYIAKTADGAEASGYPLDVNCYCSMNMWGFRKESVGPMLEGFHRFFHRVLPRDPMNAEFLLPVFMGELVERKMVSVKVLPTTDTWYGITVREDIEDVREAFAAMIDDGVYTEELYRG